MKVVLELNGKVFQETNVARDNQEGIESIIKKYNRLAKIYKADYKIYLVAKSKLNSIIRSINYHAAMAEDKKTIERPPAHYSNTSPMGIAKEVLP